jgi:hypothetical protein
MGGTRRPHAEQLCADTVHRCRVFRPDFEELLQMTKTIDQLLDEWPNVAPFKGELISDDGCMCAQGQVLHFVCGMTADELRDFVQIDADRRVAKEMGISLAHSILLRQVNDSVDGAPACVIRETERVLGGEAQTVLAFWRHLDRMSGGQWAATWDAARAATWAAAGDAARAATWDAARAAAGAAAWDAAGAAAGDAAWDAAMDAAWDATRDAAWAAARDAAWAAAWAANEIQGAAIMRERGQPFFFLPMFGFDTPEAVLEAGK